jgi:hypothetical protein
MTNRSVMAEEWEAGLSVMPHSTEA